MSTVASTSPSFEKNDRELAALKTQNFSDPFLTAPLQSDEQLVPINSAELEASYFSASPTHDLDPFRSHIPSDHNLSSNPSHRTSPTSYPDFLSSTDHTENCQSDFTSFTSPDFESPFFIDDRPSNLDEANNLLWVNPQDIDRASPLDMNSMLQQKNAESSIEKGVEVSQLQSQVHKNTPSPTVNPQALQSGTSLGDITTTSPLSIMSGRQSRVGIPTHSPPEITTTSTHNAASLIVNDDMNRDHPARPILKISSFSRGDSPSREEETLDQGSGKRGRGTMSSGHLSPARDQSPSYFDSDGHESIYGQRRTISVPPHASRDDDGNWFNPLTGQGGLDPSSRQDIYVPSLKDITAELEREEKNANVAQWICLSEANSEIEDNGASNFRSRRRKLSLQSRRRAKSTGDPFLSTHGGANSRPDRQRFDDSAIPGPGILIDEESGREDGDDEYYSDSSPPASVDVDIQQDENEGDIAPAESAESSETEPLPRQFIRSRPWQDPVTNSSYGDTKQQPANSNAAIMRFLNRADNIDTASRQATWGTRGLSESDVDSIIGTHGRFSSIRISEDKKDKPVRSNSLLKQAKGLFPKRGNSAKRKHTDQQNTTESSDKPTSDDTGHSSSHSNFIPQRKISFNRGSKSPHLNTGGAVLAMTGQMAAVGRGGGVTVPSPSSAGTPWSHLRRHSRSRSRSEQPGHSEKNHGALFNLMTSHGGPPIPTLASPPLDKSPKDSPLTPQAPDDNGDNNDRNVDDEEDELIDDKGITMDFQVRADLIVPTLEGFKTHVRQINPRLQPALIERVAQEQVRRYKKLVEMKVKHSQEVKKNSCRAGKYCFAQGGEAKMLPPKTSPKDPESTYAQFQVPGATVTDEELAIFGDGAITPALFPSGVPLPPVNRLPAEFECSLCFKVKKFMKPSDWTKHVHEDVQPFTCTFPECTEPKSFKRKADWVRHENERHRHLEWWMCNMDDCTHTCYRKDNFVQHLVREHRIPEPKAKAIKPRKGAASGGQGQTTPVENQTGNAVWALIDECRHVSKMQPTEEACRFCGNVCSSWKKLTVHLARHMEQIALPVLELVKQRSVSVDTNLSPADQGGITPQSQGNLWTTPVSPYAGSNETPSTTFGMGAPPTEPFMLTHSPLLSNDITQKNNTESSAASQVHSQQQQQHLNYMTSGRSYSASPYPEATDQKQYGVNINSAASYPPSFAPLSREPQQDVASLSGLAALPILQQEPQLYHNQQPSTAANMGYNLDVTPPVENSGYDEQPQIFASPVDNARFMQPPNQESMAYTTPTSGMNYHIMTSAADGSMPADNGYIQHGGGAYQQQDNR